MKVKCRKMKELFLKIATREGMEYDEIVEFSETGAIFSQSEIIDFSKGVDSEGP